MKIVFCFAVGLWIMFAITKVGTVTKHKQAWEAAAFGSILATLFVLLLWP